MRETRRTLQIRPAAVTRVLWVTLGILVAASIGAQVLRYAGGYRSAMGFVPQFMMDKEQNAPTYFSTIILLLAAVLLGLIATFKQRDGALYARHWSGLALIFLFLSLDEAAGFHELMNRPTDALISGSGVFLFAWVVPALILVGIFASAYLKFLLHLPRRTRILFAAAGLIYVGGALGIEMGGGYYTSLYGLNNPVYTAIATVEETLEIAGIVLFVRALLDYMSRETKEVQLRFGA